MKSKVNWVIVKSDATVINGQAESFLEAHQDVLITLEQEGAENSVLVAFGDGLVYRQFSAETYGYVSGYWAVTLDSKRN